MESFTSAVNLIAAAGTLIMQVITVAVIVWFFAAKNKVADPYLKFISRNAYIVSFFDYDWWDDFEFGLFRNYRLFALHTLLVSAHFALSGSTPLRSSALERRSHNH